MLYFFLIVHGWFSFLPGHKYNFLLNITFRTNLR